jgi:glutamine amidotransferase
MIVTIVDYGAGNLRSAAKAFALAADRLGGPVEVRVSGAAEDVRAADRVVLPGDGAFADCRRALAATPGMDEALEERVRRDGKPFLGICVGMQLLATTGMEHGPTPGLGWIPGECVRIAPRDPRLKVPHMGWNTLSALRPHPLLDGIELGPDGLHAYFLHGWHMKPAEPADIIAESDYGGPITALVGRGNIAGVQFHPEKSQALGLKLVENFLRWRP